MVGQSSDLYFSQFFEIPRAWVDRAEVSAVTTPALLQRLTDAAGALRERGVISDETLLQRAQWLKEDLEVLNLETFEILPTQWIEPAAWGCEFRWSSIDSERPTTTSNRQPIHSTFPKDVRLMEGTHLNRGELGYFGKVAEIGHTVIPKLWLANRELRERLRLPTQHLDTLNEVWWLSRWHGIDPDSVELEPLVRRNAENLSKRTPATMDWRLTVLGRQVAINLSVKNRRGTFGSRPFGKGVYLFGDEPDKPFAESGDDEINVLAITAYRSMAGGFRSRKKPISQRSFWTGKPALAWTVRD